MTLRALRNLLLDNVHDTRLRDSAQITQLVTLARNDLPHDTAHDLGGEGTAWVSLSDRNKATKQNVPFQNASWGDR